jgi:hypothetical protein
MRDVRCNILADIEDDKIVSPKRIKQLIREGEIIIKTFKRFEGTKHAGDAALQIKKLRVEIETWKSLLAAADKVIDDPDAAIYTVTGDDAQALRNMKLEWETHSAGISSQYTRHIKPGAVDLPRAAGSEG